MLNKATNKTLQQHQHLSVAQKGVKSKKKKRKKKSAYIHFLLHYVCLIMVS